MTVSLFWYVVIGVTFSGMEAARMTKLDWFADHKGTLVALLIWSVVIWPFALGMWIYEQTGPKSQ
jgi:hypothetical protein